MFIGEGMKYATGELTIYNEACMIELPPLHKTLQLVLKYYNCYNFVQRAYTASFDVQSNPCPFGRCSSCVIFANRAPMSQRNFDSDERSICGTYKGSMQLVTTEKCTSSTIECKSI
jgi:hypothetical protein